MLERGALFIVELQRMIIAYCNTSRKFLSPLANTCPIIIFSLSMCLPLVKALTNLLLTILTLGELIGIKHIFTHLSSLYILSILPLPVAYVFARPLEDLHYSNFSVFTGIVRISAMLSFV